MIQLNFKKFLENLGGGSFLPTSWTGSEGDPTMVLTGHPNFLPGTDFVANNDLNLPMVQKQGIVKTFIFNKNPIAIELADGTKLFLTFNQYKRIQGDLPIVPKFTRLSVSFQRLPDDLTMNTSQIAKCVSQFIGPEWLRKHYKIGYTYKP
jgi:hypothetical protein